MRHIQPVSVQKAQDTVAIVFLQVWAAVFSLILSLAFTDGKR